MANTTAFVPADPTTPTIYWPDFGPLQYAEVIYMTIITVLGTVGNLIVIFSIALEKRVHAHGNIFIINLAVADFLVSSLVNPTVIAHIINGKDAIGFAFCDVIAYLVTSTCTCSLLNLMFIAINRYWAVVKPATYQKTFRRKSVYYMMASTWIFSIIVVCPTVLGWGRLAFDYKILVCLWDDTYDYGYTWFITTVAVIIPMGIIGYCYVMLFRTVRGSGRWVRSLSVGSGISQQSEQHRRSMRKERSLLRTLITTVVLFCICWVPFALCVLINPGSTPPHLKKVAGWLALTNSCVNFIIYGAMNPVFRRGYRNLFIFVFRCKRAQHISSAMLHGSFSDSFRSRRGLKGLQIRNGSVPNNLSEVNSRNDSMGGMPPAISQVTEMTMPSNSPILPRIITSTQDLKEPSPLTRRSLPTFSNENRAVNITPLVIAKTKKIEMGEDASSDEEEFKQAHQSRYARRSQSEQPISKQKNANHNNQQNHAGVVLDVKGITSEYLRRSWLPDRAVYTSKQNTPINGSPNISPSRKAEVVTVSNGVAHDKSGDKKRYVVQTENDEPSSPTEAPLIAPYSNDSDNSDDNGIEISDKSENENVTITDSEVTSSGPSVQNNVASESDAIGDDSEGNKSEER